MDNFSQIAKAATQGATAQPIKKKIPKGYAQLPSGAVVRIPKTTKEADLLLEIDAKEKGIRDNKFDVRAQANHRAAPRMGVATNAPSYGPSEAKEIIRKKQTKALSPSELIGKILEGPQGRDHQGYSDLMDEATDRVTTFGKEKGGWLGGHVSGAIAGATIGQLDALNTGAAGTRTGSSGLGAEKDASFLLTAGGMPIANTVGAVAGGILKKVKGAKPVDVPASVPAQVMEEPGVTYRAPAKKTETLTKDERALIHSAPKEELENIVSMYQISKRQGKPVTPRSEEVYNLAQARLDEQNARFAGATTDNTLVIDLQKSLESRGAGMPPARKGASRGSVIVPTGEDLKTAGRNIARGGRAVLKGSKELNKVARFAQLGADAGALLRQGGSALINNPKAWWTGVKQGTKAAASDDALEQFITGIETRQVEVPVKNAKGGYDVQTLDLAPIREKAGLSLTGSGVKEEGFASSVVEFIGKKVPALGKLERFQTAFMNSVRSEMFDDFVKAFPDATEEELKRRAKFINSTLGRSNIKEVPEVFEQLMTSPRWTKSRWEMAAQYARTPETAARALAGDKAAQQNLFDLGRTAGAMLAVYKLAEASGAKVELTDPSSPDFLKIRVGDTVYDPTSSVAAPIRTVLRLYYMTGVPKATGQKGIEVTPRKNWGSEISSTLVNTLGPGPRTLTNNLVGKSISGYDLKDDEKGWAQLMPLIAKGMKETWDEDGPTAALARGAVEFLGVNSNKFPAKKREDRPKKKAKPERKAR